MLGTMKDYTPIHVQIADQFIQLFALRPITDDIIKQIISLLYNMSDRYNRGIDIFAINESANI